MGWMQGVGPGGRDPVGTSGEPLGHVCGLLPASLLSKAAPGGLLPPAHSRAQVVRPLLLLTLNAACHQGDSEGLSLGAE